MADERTIGVDEREPDEGLDDAALEALAEAYAAPPSAALRGRVLAAARRDRIATRARTTIRRWRVVGTAVAGLALVLGGLLAVASERDAARARQLAALARQNDALALRVAEQERTLVGLRDALAAQATVLRVIGGPRTLSASLAPQAGGQGSGRVLVDASSGEAAIVVTGLAPLPEGRTYELWAIRGTSAPEPAGLFAVPGDRPIAARAERVERPGEVTAFAVSIEPAAGSKSPTGPVVLAGPVAS